MSDDHAPLKGPVLMNPKHAVRVQGRNEDQRVEIHFDGKDINNSRRSVLLRMDDSVSPRAVEATDIRRPTAASLADPTFVDHVIDTLIYRIDVPPGKYLVLLFRTDVTLVRRRTPYELLSSDRIATDRGTRDSPSTAPDQDVIDRHLVQDWFADPSLNALKQTIVSIF